MKNDLFIPLSDNKCVLKRRLQVPTHDYKGVFGTSE